MLLIISYLHLLNRPFLLIVFVVKKIVFGFDLFVVLLHLSVCCLHGDHP